jgi:6-phosphogluconolactonase
MNFLFSFLFLFFFLGGFAQQNYYMLVGTYTSSSSKGIYVFDFNTANAESHPLSFVESSNPSYLEVSPNGKYVYAVNENADTLDNGGKVSAFSFDARKGVLSYLNQQPSKGNHPCYVTVDKTGKWVIAGNYSSGTITVLPVLKGGALDVPATTLQHYGESVNTERQNSSHVHATVLSPDNKFLFVPDLGIDKLITYHFDDHFGKLSATSPPFIMTKAGSGPRHFIFHSNKKFAYLAEELTGSVSAYRYMEKTGQLELIQNISSLPPEYMGPAGSADIHVSPDGNFLYVSNRGESNSIAIFAINKSNGSLILVGHQSTLGKTPRHFNFDPGGNFLLVANQNSDNIVIFKINKSTGLLTDTGKRISVGKPVCIKWIKKKK